MGPSPSDVIHLQKWLEAHPLDPELPLKAVPVKRTPTMSCAIVQVRTRERPHSHAAHDLTVHVLRGRGRLFMVSDLPGPGAGASATAFTCSVARVSAGDFILVPRGLVHWFVNESRAPSVALACFTPPLERPDSVPVQDRATLRRLLKERGID